MRKNSMIGAVIVSALLVAGAVSTAFAQADAPKPMGATTGAMQPPMMMDAGMMANMQQMAQPLMTMVKYYDGNVYTLAGMLLTRYDANTLMQKGMVMLEVPTSTMMPPAPMPDGTTATPQPPMRPMMHRNAPVFFLKDDNAIVIGDHHFYRVSIKDMRVTQFTVLPDMPAMPPMMDGMMAPGMMMGGPGMMGGNPGMKDGMPMKGGMPMKDGMPMRDGVPMNDMNQDMRNNMQMMMMCMNMMKMMMPPPSDRDGDMLYIVRGTQLVALDTITGKVTAQAPIMMGGMNQMTPRAATVVKISAKQYEFYPKNITLKKGVPVTLEFTSLDVNHGFNCPGLGIRTDIMPNKISDITFTPDKVGTFDFHCDVMCGPGHKDMKGTIIVTE
ncbi:MAG: cupredoxin domain-containing protein [bacterium]